MPSGNVMETDVLVIGGGLAGIFAAIKAKEEGIDVTLVDKNYVSRSGATAYADGCFSIFNPEWGHDLDFWMTNIRVTGEYMNNPEWTEISLKESYDRYQDIESWGIRFLRKENGELIRFRKADFQISDIQTGSLKTAIHPDFFRHLFEFVETGDGPGHWIENQKI